MEIVRAKKHILLPILALILLVIGIFAWLNKDNLSSAADARNFNASNIMSDAVMTNKSSMSEAQIQAFLLSKNACNDTNTAKAASYPHLSYNIKNGKFVCLAEESFSGESAAHIIWQAGQDYNINPQVLIVLLEKEQGLITDTWPNNIQYRSATGYGCPDTAACETKYYGFKNQVRNAANFFRAYQTGNTGWYKTVWPGDKYTGTWQKFNYALQWHPNIGCGTVNTRIENRATASLYSYTPYRPNQAALNAQTGTGDGCSSYGNRNFWMFFNDWFGSTSGYTYNGTDISKAFNATYYLNKYPDLKAAFGDNPAAAFNHFIEYGIYEGRQSAENFDIVTYKARNTDLRFAFGSDLFAYCVHYATIGYKENRVTTGNQTAIPITSYKGVDYSAVYNYSEYIAKYSDLKKFYSNDDAGALVHFVNYGMKESRVAISTFDVTKYRMRYYDLRNAFGSDLKQYYLHYIQYGQKEKRIATGDTYYGGVTARNGIEYSAVYDYNYYITKQSDIKTVFGYDDKAALDHFITYGMKEGRQAKETFSVKVYKANYSDLRNAFGSDLKQYYLHYINYGKKEGRVAS